METQMQDKENQMEAGFYVGALIWILRQGP